MTEGKLAFEYSDGEIDQLERALSAERFQTYVLAAGGRRRQAVFLYEKNTALSEALYGVTQAAEVTFRNAVHSALSDAAGPMWFDAMALEELQQTMVSEAKYELEKSKRNVTPGAVVAELGLGFWTALLSSKYEKRLWVPHLYKAFPNAWLETQDRKGDRHRKAIDRAAIHLRLEEIRNLRNRIAHHEPIIKLDLPRAYSDTLKAIFWVSATAARWVIATNCFPRRFHQYRISAMPKAETANAPSAPVPGTPRVDV